MKKEWNAADKKAFCRAYLRTLDPERAAEEAGLSNGCALLHDRDIRERLERMRGDWNAQIMREDAVRRLAELAFGRANDAAALALAGIATGAALAFGVESTEIATVTGAVTALISVATYVVTEGAVDIQRLQSIGDMLEEDGGYGDGKAAD